MTAAKKQEAEAALEPEPTVDELKEQLGFYQQELARLSSLYGEASRALGEATVGRRIDEQRIMQLEAQLRGDTPAG